MGGALEVGWNPCSWVGSASFFVLFFFFFSSSSSAFFFFFSSSSLFCFLLIRPLLFVSCNGQKLLKSKLGGNNSTTKVVPPRPKSIPNRLWNSCHGMACHDMPLHAGACRGMPWHVVQTFGRATIEEMVSPPGKSNCCWGLVFTTRPEGCGRIF